MQRIEVWFNNGLFRGFPKVTRVEEGENYLCLEFGEHHHQAKIIKANVNFFEVCEEPEN